MKFLAVLLIVAPAFAFKEYLQTNRLNETEIATRPTLCMNQNLDFILKKAIITSSHNMGEMNTQILYQLKNSGRPGHWLVYSQLVSSIQGSEWQASSLYTPLFEGNDFHFCYYFDKSIFVMVARVYTSDNLV